MERKSKWEVAPTKDAIHAFIETLVDPKLPYMASIVQTPPSIDLQKSIAGQMHAVALLYNYFHRKQKPELEFLDFVPFCKCALEMRAKLKPFMRVIEGIEAGEIVASKDNLSMTERAVKSACDIAKSLDASRDVPITKGYPISTVAVLLVDPEKEKCMLQYSAVTEGVWSLIEKEVDVLGEGQEMLADGGVHKKRKISEQQPLSDHSKFLRIGFDAVKNVSGIEVSDLEVLDEHVVYSLSKEESAAQFYIMKGKKSLDPKKTHALHSLVESLSGPFANEHDGAWVTSDLVEYHRLLPYAELISKWLARKASSKPILIYRVAQIIKGKEVPTPPPSRMRTSPSAEYSVHNKSDTRRTTRSLTRIANVDSKFSGKKGDDSSSRKVTNPDDEPPLIETSKKGMVGLFNTSAKKERTKPNTRSVASGLKKGPSLKGKSPSVLTFFSSEVEKKADSKKRGYHQRSNSSSSKNDENVAGDDASLNDDTANLNDDQNRDKWLSKMHSSEAKSAKHSTDLQNALALVERNRETLYLRICDMEETLALYELVIDRIRDGEDVDLVRRTIKHIVDGNDHLLLYEIVSRKETASPTVYLPGKSSIQDLLLICQKNDGRLPRYDLNPSSNGQFVSTVSVRCFKEFLTAKGSEERSPFKARESAAAQMIAQIKAHIDSTTQQK